MTLEEIQKEVEAFFEFPTVDKDHVTTTSAILFARHCVEKSANAEWLATAHQLCTDLGVEQGHINKRLEDLRELLDVNGWV